MKTHNCKSILQPDWINIKMMENTVWFIYDKLNWILPIKYCPYCGTRLGEELK